MQSVAIRSISKPPFAVNALKVRYGMGREPTFAAGSTNVCEAQETAGAKLRTGVALRSVTGPQPPFGRLLITAPRFPEADFQLLAYGHSLCKARFEKIVGPARALREYHVTKDKYH